MDGDVKTLLKFAKKERFLYLSFLIGFFSLQKHRRSLSMTVSPSTVVDRLEYGKDWKDLDTEEEGTIWRTLTAQVNTTYYRKNLHSMVAEWINENYYLDLDMEVYDPDEDALKLDTVQAKVKTTQHGGHIYLDVPHQRQPVAKKSYTGTLDLERAIHDAVEVFAENHDLFTRGVLSEVKNNAEIDPERLRGIEEHVYERVAGDFGRRYLGDVEESIRSLNKVKKNT